MGKRDSPPLAVFRAIVGWVIKLNYRIASHWNCHFAQVTLRLGLFVGFEKQKEEQRKDDVCVCIQQNI